MNTKVVRKVVIYARTSTDKQATGLASQIDACKNFCAQKGWLYEVITDEAVSGAETERVGLNELMGRLPSRCWDALVVFSFSRLSRSLIHILDMHNTLLKADVQLVSLTEQVDTTTPMGKAMFGMIGVLSEMQRDVHSEATANGLRVARKTGRFNPDKKQFSDEKIAEMKRLNKEGMSQAEIGARYGITQSCVSNYIKGIKRRKVDGKSIRVLYKSAEDREICLRKGTILD